MIQSEVKVDVPAKLTNKDGRSVLYGNFTHSSRGAFGFLVSNSLSTNIFLYPEWEVEYEVQLPTKNHALIEINQILYRRGYDGQYWVDIRGNVQEDVSRLAESARLGKYRVIFKGED